MSKKFILAAALAMSLGMFAVTDNAQARGHGQVDMPELTAEQKTELTTLRNDFHKATDPINVELAKKRTELRAIMLQEKPDSKTASRLAGEIETLEQDLRDIEISFRTEVSEKFDLPMHRGMRGGKHHQMDGRNQCYGNQDRGEMRDNTTHQNHKNSPRNM